MRVITRKELERIIDQRVKRGSVQNGDFLFCLGVNLALTTLSLGIAALHFIFYLKR